MVENQASLFELANKVRDQLRKYVVLPDEHCEDAVTLWILHTHFIEQMDSSPRLAVVSAEKGSGKSRLLEIVSALSLNSEMMSSTTASVLFRSIDAADGMITLLVDEADAVFGRVASGDEPMRAVINGGYRRGATVARSASNAKGNEWKPQQFKCFAPVVLASIGDLPDTIMDRAVVVRMKPRLASEAVAGYRESRHRAALLDLASALTTKAQEIVLPLDPAMPEGIRDRDQDVWEPLLMIADACGAEWGERARVAAVALTAKEQESSEPLGKRLLKAIQSYLAVRPELKAVKSGDIVQYLGWDDDGPWRRVPGYGREIDAALLAKILQPYEVRPKDIRFSDGVFKGYHVADFEDGFRRYLPEQSDSAVESA